MKPLFIPLAGKWFDAFKDGSKTTEYRQYGPRWNEVTCAIGRPIVLSRGYSGERLRGRIASFEKRQDRTHEYLAIYGESSGPMAAIGIALGGPPP